MRTRTFAFSRKTFVFSRKHIAFPQETFVLPHKIYSFSHKCFAFPCEILHCLTKVLVIREILHSLTKSFLANVSRSTKKICILLRNIYKLFEKYCIPWWNFPFASKGTEILFFLPHINSFTKVSQVNPKVCEWIQSFSGKCKSFTKDCKIPEKIFSLPSHFIFHHNVPLGALYIAKQLIECN